jgi:hypothetical protein
MVPGALLPICDERGSIALAVLPTTICTAHVRQCHALPLTKRLFLWGGSCLYITVTSSYITHWCITLNGTSALVHFTVDNAPLLQVHGIREDHRIVCQAVRIDHAWYQGVAAG